MLRLVPLLSVALLGIACTPTQPLPDEAARANAPRIAVDVGVLVADMEAALAFYRDGLELAPQGTVVAFVQEPRG